MHSTVKTRSVSATELQNLRVESEVADGIHERVGEGHLAAASHASASGSAELDPVITRRNHRRARTCPSRSSPHSDLADARRKGGVLRRRSLKAEGKEGK